MQSLQDRLAPNSSCFGCGPKNAKGLRIKSFVSGGPEGELVAEWRPSPEHEAFDGVVNGGIIGALLDCHSNWTAAYHLMQTRAAPALPCTVTADFHVTLKRPTPSAAPLKFFAHVAGGEGDKVIVEARVEAGGKVTATCVGTFVAVKEGHPAYHRWGEPLS